MRSEGTARRQDCSLPQRCAMTPDEGLAVRHDRRRRDQPPLRARGSVTGVGSPTASPGSVFHTSTSSRRRASIGVRQIHHPSGPGSTVKPETSTDQTSIWRPRPKRTKKAASLESASVRKIASSSGRPRPPRAIPRCPGAIRLQSSPDRRIDSRFELSETWKRRSAEAIVASRFTRA